MDGSLNNGGSVQLGKVVCAATVSSQHQHGPNVMRRGLVTYIRLS